MKTQMGTERLEEQNDADSISVDDALERVEFGRMQILLIVSLNFFFGIINIFFSSNSLAGPFSR